jgi:predicted NBD/HSP70 family sugar kinase
MLINGRPNRGCVTGGNELGHNRFLVETDRCFCGHVGCLERIVTTDFVHRCDRASRGATGGQRQRGRAGANGDQSTLPARVVSYGSHGEPDAALETLIRYLSCGVANAINFIRPHCVLLINEIGAPRQSAFNAALRRAVRDWLLPELIDRVQLDIVAEPAVGSAESAAWLAIAELVHGGWSHSGD